MPDRTRHFLMVLSAAVAFFFAYLIAMSDAEAFEFAQLREVSLDVRQYLPGGSYPLVTDNGLRGRVMDKELDLTVDADLAKYLYLNTLIHTMTDRDNVNGGGQFRLVGLELSLGLRITRGLEAGYYHYSQHLLDYAGPWRYPIQDAVQVRLYLYRVGALPSLF